jgi:hypothetical protein
MFFFKEDDMSETVAQYSLRIHGLIDELQNQIKIMESRLFVQREEIKDRDFHIRALQDLKDAQHARIVSLQDENRMLKESLRQGGRVRFVNVEA